MTMPTDDVSLLAIKDRPRSRTAGPLVVWYIVNLRSGSARDYAAPSSLRLLVAADAHIPNGVDVYMARVGFWRMG